MSRKCCQNQWICGCILSDNYHLNHLKSLSIFRWSSDRSHYVKHPNFTSSYSLDTNAETVSFTKLSRRKTRWTYGIFHSVLSHVISLVLLISYFSLKLTLFSYFYISNFLFSQLYLCLLAEINIMNSLSFVVPFVIIFFWFTSPMLMSQHLL